MHTDPRNVIEIISGLDYYILLELVGQ